MPTVEQALQASASSPSDLTVTQEDAGLRASWTSAEAEFVVERERYMAGGTPP